MEHKATYIEHSFCYPSFKYHQVLTVIIEYQSIIGKQGYLNK